ncbi:MAG: ATP-dependent DNA helicase RecG, partial [Chloroflexi bacterium]|nr:ATP-dependent DNA helicase RecG [Chloroflexota bacterium]
MIRHLAGPNVVDLLWHLPSGLIDRRFAPKVADAPPGAIATMTLRVGAHKPPRTGRLPYKVTCSDDTGELDLVFFHARPDYLQRVLPEGEMRVISGRIERWQGRLQITHPDHIATTDEIASLQTIEPVYPLTAGLTPRPLGRAIKGALERAPELDEWSDPAWLRQEGWAGWRAALHTAHGPDGEVDLRPDTPARRRLAYDELLASQLALLLVRTHQRRLPGRRIDGDGRLSSTALAALP